LQQENPTRFMPARQAATGTDTTPASAVASGKRAPIAEAPDLPKSQAPEQRGAKQKRRHDGRRFSCSCRATVFQ
jgi:hypothetical protein